MTFCENDSTAVAEDPGVYGIYYLESGQKEDEMSFYCTGREIDKN